MLENCASRNFDNPKSLLTEILHRFNINQIVGSYSFSVFHILCATVTGIIRLLQCFIGLIIVSMSRYSGYQLSCLSVDCSLHHAHTCCSAHSQARGRSLQPLANWRFGSVFRNSIPPTRYNFNSSKFQMFLDLILNMVICKVLSAVGTFSLNHFNQLLKASLTNIYHF